MVAFRLHHSCVFLKRVPENLKLTKQLPITYTVCIDVFMFCMFSWHERHEYCWNQDKRDCLAVETSITDSNNHGKGNEWYCFVVTNTNATLAARKCNKKDRRRYICE